MTPDQVGATIISAGLLAWLAASTWTTRHAKTNTTPRDGWHPNQPDHITITITDLRCTECGAIYWQTPTTGDDYGRVMRATRTEWTDALDWHRRLDHAEAAA